jgi:hypothetical protein
MKNVLLLAVAAVGFGACAGTPAMPVDNAALPEAVRVPAGRKMVPATPDIGEITHGRRAKAGPAGGHERVFVGQGRAPGGDLRGRLRVLRDVSGKARDAAAHGVDGRRQ